MEKNNPVFLIFQTCREVHTANGWNWNKVATNLYEMIHLTVFHNNTAVHGKVQTFNS